jgi:hypothetical protein
MAKESKSKKADDIPTGLILPDQDELDNIFESNEYTAQPSGGSTVVWNEMLDKPDHRDLLLRTIDNYLDKRGYKDSFIRTKDGKIRTFNTIRKDILAKGINDQIERINTQYDVLADSQNIPEEQREPPIHDRLTIGEKQLSTDVSSFNNAMIKAKLPYKWNVRKNTQYTVIKLQRIEG